MAFPVIAGVANALTTSNSTSINFTYPTSIAAGELLVGIAALDGNGQLTLTGWTPVASDSQGPVRLQLFYKFASGAETGSFTLTNNASEQASSYILRITGAHASEPPNAWISGASGASTTPDSPDFNPNTWGVEDTLWIACMACDTSRTVSAFPTNCANNRNSAPSGGAGGATAAFASANSAVDSFDPDAWTISASDDWVAHAIAVRPAAAGKARPIFQPRPRFFARSFR